MITTLGMKSVFFLGDSGVFPYTMAATDIWKELGWGTIVYLAAITGIDPTYYEAARMDGAGKFKQVLYVTIPGILPMILLMMVLSVGNVLQAGFEQVFNLPALRYIQQAILLIPMSICRGRPDLTLQLRSACLNRRFPLC